jgi:type II secretory pathway component PulF
MTIDAAVTLIPVILTLVGFGLFWLATWQSQNRSLSESRIQQIVLKACGTILLVLGLFGILLMMTGPLIILALPIGLVVFFAAVIRYRKTEGRTLVWAMTVAAERGIPLETAARAFGAERDDLLGKRARMLADYLDSGVPLSLALHRSRFVVSPEVLLAADLGERTNSLGSALRRIVGRSDDFEAGIRSAMEKIFYLVFLVTWMIAILTFMMIKIVPVFQRIFEEFGMELPDATQALIGVSQFVVQFGFVAIPLWLGLIVVLVIGLVAYMGVPYRTLPILRRMSGQLDNAVILRLLSLAVEQGRPIGESLRFLAGYFPLSGPRAKLERAAKRIGDGAIWQDALWKVGLLSRAEGRLLASAERAKNLAWALDEMADSKSRRSAYRIRAWISVLFPVSILSFGSVVMFVAVGLMLPLFKLVSDLT